MKRRVVISGIGVISSLGKTTAEFWRACMDGESVVESIPERWREHADYRSSVWSPLAPIDWLAEGYSRVEAVQQDPVALYAGLAAREALHDAGHRFTLANRRANTLVADTLDSERCGVFVGTGIGGANSFLDSHAYQVLANPKQRLQAVQSILEEQRAETGDLTAAIDCLVHGSRFNPFVVPMLMPNAPAAFLGLKYSFNGPNLAFTVACASGTVAVGHAYRAVRDGLVDTALSGGCEYLDDYYGGIFRGFDIARTLACHDGDPSLANRPFDESRSGFWFSQGGAAMLVLESLDSAKARDATIYAEVLGFAETFDAHSMMQIAPDGIQNQRMITAALADAGLGPSDIDYINAHGTGTETNDTTEAAVIERVFGPRVLVNASKSLLGHTIGASGAMEAAVTALGLYRQETHACRNLQSPIADLNFVRGSGTYPMTIGFTQS